MRLLSILIFFNITLLSPSYAIDNCIQENKNEFLSLNERIYRAYEKIDKNSKVTEVRKAFWIDGAKESRKALFLAHGYLGTPREMLPLAEPFLKEGYTVIGFLIPGHGSTSKVANFVKYQRWQQEFKRQFDLVLDCFSDVSAIGFSTGGLLIHDYLLRNTNAKSLKSVHLISPFYVQRLPSFWDGIFEYLFNQISIETVYTITHFPDLRIMTLEQDIYNQDLPLSAARQIKTLGLEVYSDTGEYQQSTVPLQVFLSEGDWTADIESSKKVIKRDFSTPEFNMFNSNYPHHLHSAKVSKVAAKIVDKIYQFSKK